MKHAEMIMWCFLDMANSGYMDGLSRVMEENIEFNLCYLNNNPFLPFGHQALDQEGVGLRNLVNKINVIRMVAPDYFYEAEYVDLRNEGMTLETVVSMTATQIGHIASPHWDPSVKTASLQMIESSDSEGGGGPEVKIEFSMSLWLNRFGKVFKMENRMRDRNNVLKEEEVTKEES